MTSVNSPRENRAEIGATIGAASSLRRLGSRLIIRRGQTLATLRALLDETRATAVFWNRRYEPAVVARDSRVQAALQNDGRIVESFNGSLMFEPWTVQSQKGQPYQVFTPFWRACLLATPQPVSPEDAPLRIANPRRWPATLKLAELELEPAIDWAAGFRASWRPGEVGASQQLNCFLEEALDDYPTGRNRPDQMGTSRLSPHVHFGEISVRQIWHALRELRHDQEIAQPAEVIRVFCNELGWREFAHHLLFHFPHTTQQPLRKEFACFPWQSDRDSLLAWQQGRTGYPIVDAGMRELWHTGWLHNRVRMIVASFLVKDLPIRWQEDAAWFWDTLVDADLANNTLGWQWIDQHRRTGWSMPESSSSRRSHFAPVAQKPQIRQRWWALVNVPRKALELHFVLRQASRVRRLQCLARYRLPHDCQTAWDQRDLRQGDASHDRVHHRGVGGIDAAVAGDIAHDGWVEQWVSVEAAADVGRDLGDQCGIERREYTVAGNVAQVRHDVEAVVGDRRDAAAVDDDIAELQNLLLEK